MNNLLRAIPKEMQLSPVSLGALALAVSCAHGVAIVQKTASVANATASSNFMEQKQKQAFIQELAEEVEEQISHDEAEKPRMLNARMFNEHDALVSFVDHTMVTMEKKDHILLRPSAGKGPDPVKFAVRVKNFYGTHLAHHTFSIDVVMTIKWNDPRVISLLPKGLDKMSMSTKQASEIVWMPGVVVSNRDIEKYEIIAASVTIYRTGEVRRVERANARVMKKYQLADYPFDSQELKVIIASSKYMADEVVLVPEKLADKHNASGVEENIWGLYDMQGWEAGAYTTKDGELEKSRGYLAVTVKRSLEKYSQDHLMPSFTVMMISWSVFYFPFANPFIMARLALSILALLTFTNLTVKSTKALPGAAEYNWNDLFNQQVQSLMFITIVGNIFSEILMHQFFEEKLARHVNHAAKIVVPTLSIVSISMILSAGHYKYMSLENATWWVQVALNVFAVALVIFEVYKLVKADKFDLTKDLVEEKKANAV